MKLLTQFKTTIRPVRKPEGSVSAGFLIPLLLVCFGLAPMAQAVGPDTEGSIPGSNNGEGIGVLASRTTGVWNTGTGFEALNHLTSGNQNTATGLRALNNDINGGFNTATGVYSLFANTSGFFNSATGAYSLANNISGTHNTANGYAALYRNADADDNTATRYAALYHDIAGQTFGAGGITCYVDNAGKLGVFSSWRRLKSDISDMAAASKALLALRPVTFHYKPELDKLGIPQFGLVAEEVAKVNPDLVTH